MAYDKPIIIEKQDENEEWKHYISLHAKVNKTNQKEYVGAGATQNKRTLTFKLRYCKPLDSVADTMQIYRVVYRGVKYNIVSTDDYMELHLDFKIIGESY